MSQEDQYKQDAAKYLEDLFEAAENDELDTFGVPLAEIDPDDVVTAQFERPLTPREKRRRGIDASN